VAVDSRGKLHIVFARGETTYYVKYDYAAGAILIAETLVGSGWDPQVALDSKDRPHVAFGGRGFEKMMYAYWTGSGFSAPIEVMEARDRQRVVVDSQDRVYLSSMRYRVPRVRLHVFQNGERILSDVEIGVNDFGSLCIDSANKVHALWRQRHSMYHSSYAIGDSTDGIVAAADMVGWESSSDNGWITVDREDILHAVHTHVGGKGIDYAYRAAGAAAWSAEVNIGGNETHSDPDLTNPTVESDGRGYKYVAFSGDEYVPKYFVIGPDGALAVPVSAVDGSSRCGGKYENPNVGSRLDMVGAYVAWHSGGMVYVRRLGRVGM
jgi:hypothetical protein